MKFDDAINGLLAICLGAGMILLARDMPTVRHIDYGPGLFPTIVGAGLMGAGLILIARRFLKHEGIVDGWISKGSNEFVLRKAPLLTLVLVICSVIFYIVCVDKLGFLLTMPLLLFCTIWWFDRRWIRALVTAIVATFAIHSFFYQLMSVQLPWGVLTKYAGTLTW